jgi:hypothetical protein
MELSSESMLHEHYYRKGSWRQDELFGGKPPVVKFDVCWNIIEGVSWDGSRIWLRSEDSKFSWRIYVCCSYSENVINPLPEYS